MKFKRNERAKRPISTTFLYFCSGFVTLIAIAFLVTNVILFKENLAQYVEQGYPSAEVLKLLVPNQLLPGIFEPVAVYGGIAVLLWSVGLISQKVSKTSNQFINDKITSGEIEAAIELSETKTLNSDLPAEAIK